MVRSSISRFRDPHHLQNAVAGVRMDLVVTGRGAFDATLMQIDLDRISMQRGIESVARVASVTCDTDRLSIVFMTRDGPASHVSGRELEPGMALLTRLGHQYCHRTAGRAEWGSISLAPQAFAEAARIMTGDDVAFDSERQVVSSGPGLCALQRLHAQVTALAVSAPERFARKEAAKTLEQALIRAMIGLLQDGTGDPDSAARRRHTVLMARFTGILEGSPDRPLHVMDICSGLGVSEWTLRHVCHDHLGMSPKRYLLLRRMHLARKALGRAESGKATVTEIAMAQGFLELGRFAVEYRQLFGETPSATLRRSPDAEPTELDTHRLARLPEIA